VFGKAIAGVCSLSLFVGCSSSELGNLESDNSGAVADAVEKGEFDAELRAACGSGGVTAGGEQAFMRWPYLQKMTDDSVAIMWTTITDVPAADLIVTTPEGDPVAELVAERDPQSQRPSFSQYATEIDGLEPDTIYCYEIAGVEPWLGRTGFRTAPGADSDRPIRIAAIGDLGTQTSDQFAVRDELTRVEFDFVLVTGDLAYERGTLSDHERNFFEVYRDLMRSKPFFVISGNHDYANDGSVYREVFGLFENGGEAGRERWYSFDWGRAHFTAIDTEILDDVQADWVAADLEATDRAWKVAYMHRPAFSSGTHGSSATIQNLFVDSFERYGVDLVLAGHDHNYERTQPINGVTYVTTGSAGRGTRPVGSSSFTAYSESVAHFTFVEIDGLGLKLNAIDALGGDFDTVSME
jgi:predicted phosphodiesterase